MSDKPQSKAAKKNAKRNAKKHATGGGGIATSRKSDELSYREMLEILKQQLETAKETKDHTKAGKLREQIWVLTDLVAGVKTDLPQDELLTILEGIELDNKKTPATEASKPVVSTSSSNLTPEEKKLRTLKKKLQQIEGLKQRQAKGEKLETTQVAKIESADSLEEEIQELEELLRVFYTELH